MMESTGRNLPSFLICWQEEINIAVNIREQLSRKCRKEITMNRIVLIGRLTKEPELRATSSGKDIVNFSIAVNKKFKKEEADFFNVQAWEGTARYVADYLGKGRLVAIDGRLETRSYEKEGRKIYITEVIAEQVTALDRARDEAGANTSVNRASQPEPSPAYSGGEYDPFGDE